MLPLCIELIKFNHKIDMKSKELPYVYHIPRKANIPSTYCREVIRFQERILANTSKCEQCDPLNLTGNTNFIIPFKIFKIFDCNI